MNIQSFNSPLGQLQLVYNDRGTFRLLLPGQQPPVSLPALTPAAAGSPAPAARQWLEAYFEGSRQAPGMTLFPEGTPFQLRVWNALRQIPYGTTCTYAALARHIGSPAAVRAVGLAVGRNPLPVMIPCHRVVGSNGHLTGFSGGMEAKRRLLSLEGVALDREKDRLAPGNTPLRHSVAR